MNAGILGSIRTPFLTLRMVPKWPVQFPGIAVVFRLEKSAGHRAAPDDTRFIRATWSQSPNQFERPIESLPEKRNGFRNITFGHRRILGHRNLGPRLAVVVRAMQLDTEVPVIECRKEIAVAPIVHHQRNVVADKSRAADGPLRDATIHREQTFSCGYIKSI